MVHTILYLLLAVAFLHSNYASWVIQGKEYEFTGPLRFYKQGNAGEKVISNCEGLSGSICSEDHGSCDKIYVCLPNVQTPIVGTCPNGENCYKGKCSNITSTVCEYKDLKFTCNSEGMFPEPSSCKKYNYCVPPGNAAALQGQCPPGWGYNVANTLCDKKLINNMCEDTDRAVPKCNTPLQNAALKGSSSYFYICAPHSSNDKILYPNIYRCPGNTKYAGDFICK